MRTAPIMWSYPYPPIHLARGLARGASAGQTGCQALLAHRPLTEPTGDTRTDPYGIKEFSKRNMTRKIVSTLSVTALLTAGALAQAADTNAAPATSTTANSLVAGPT